MKEKNFVPLIEVYSLLVMRVLHTIVIPFWNTKMQSFVIIIILVSIIRNDNNTVNIVIRIV